MLTCLEGRESMLTLKKISGNRILRPAFDVLITLFSAVAAAHCAQHLDFSINSSLFLALFVLALFCRQDLRKNDLAKFLACWLFSFLTMQGAMLDDGDGPFSAKLILMMAAGGVDFALIRCRILKVLDPWFEKIFGNTRRKILPCLSNRKFWLVSWAVMFLCWVPTWLAFFPGLFTYDAPGQVTQTIGTYNTHHPLIHTLFLQGCLQIGHLLGDANIGVALNCLIQMILLSSVLAAVVAFARHRGTTEFHLILMQIFFCLFPVFPIMSITTTKDTLFTVFFTLFILLLAVMNEQPAIFTSSAAIRNLLIAGGVFSMLFRHNAVPVIPLVFLILCLRAKEKTERKRFLQVFIWTISLYVVINGGLVLATQATGDSNNNEMLSVPYQQIARVYTMKQDELSKDEKQEILRFIPDAADYNPIKSDEVKFTGLADEDRKGFLSLYLRMLRRYPCTYVESFLINTEGYWYIDDVTGAVNYGRGAAYGTVGYLYMYIWENLGIHHIALFPKLENWYKSYFAYNNYLGVPVWSALFRCGLYLWVGLWCLIRSFRRKQHGGMVYVTLILLLITLLLGPVVSIRYVLPFMTCFPIVMMISWCRKEQPSKIRTDLQQ